MSSLKTRKPHFINPCKIDDRGDFIRENIHIREYEVGSQGLSVERLFNLHIPPKIKKCDVVFSAVAETVYFYMSDDISPEEYGIILRGIFQGEIELSEKIHLDCTLLHMRDRVCDMCRDMETLCCRADDRDEWNLWHDFENDVFFSFSREAISRLPQALNLILKEWTEPD